MKQEGAQKLMGEAETIIDGQDRGLRRLKNANHFVELSCMEVNKKYVHEIFEKYILAPNWSPLLIIF